MEQAPRDAHNGLSVRTLQHLQGLTSGPDGAGLRWVCNQCQKTFSREDHLRRHADQHSGTRPFPCPLCSDQFSRRYGVSSRVTVPFPPPLFADFSLDCCQRYPQATLVHSRPFSIRSQYPHRISASPAFQIMSQLCQIKAAL